MALSKKTINWLNELNISLKGKNVLVTGSNSGVGLKTIETSLYLGAHVIMSCRNYEKALNAKTNLLQDYPDAKIDIMQIDLSDFSSIDEFANNIIDNKIDIDIFVNNAGTFHKRCVTKDGFENVIGTNYFGVYRLSEKIIPYLKTLPHKVYYFNTISVVHKLVKIDYKDFYCNKHYEHFNVYAKSKLCLAKYSYDLAKKLEDTNVCVYMIHPGISVTPLGANAFGSVISKLANALRGVFNSPEKSSLAMVYSLLKDLPAGSITGPSFLEVWGYPKAGKIRRCVKEGAEELIAFTESELRR